MLHFRFFFLLICQPDINRHPVNLSLVSNLSSTVNNLSVISHQQLVNLSTSINDCQPVMSSVNILSTTINDCQQPSTTVNLSTTINDCQPVNNHQRLATCHVISQQPVNLSSIISNLSTCQPIFSSVFCPLFAPLGPSFLFVSFVVLLSCSV